jgi:hypothetical protein
MKRLLMFWFEKCNLLWKSFLNKVSASMRIKSDLTSFLFHVSEISSGDTLQKLTLSFEIVLCTTAKI